ncbi:MAG: polysaccharide biosynthesis protein [Firmicutes bacterium]|nr:polysaccharide biosynthesis protein [Bacillota bacterium]
MYKDEQHNTSVTGNRFFRGTIILTIAGIVVKVIGALNWVILSRVLSGEGIGLYQMAFPLYLLALSISSAGIPVAVSIMTAERLAILDYRGANRIFKLALTMLFITGASLSLLMYIGSELLIQERLIRDPRTFYALIALSPAIFLVTIISGFRGYLQGWQIMKPTAISQIVEQVFRVGAMLFFANAFLPLGIDYAAGGASLGAAAGAAAGLLVLIYYYVRLRMNQPKLAVTTTEFAVAPVSKLIRRLVALALPVSLSSLMLPLVANFDLVIVPARLEVAGYTVKQATELFGYLTGMAVPLVNLATILTGSLTVSIVPAISEAYSLGKSQLIYWRISSAIRLANLVTIPGSAILWLLAEPVAGIIYHAPGAAPTIKALAIAIFFLGIHQVTTGALQGLGRTAIPVINMGIAALGKISLNWFLTAQPSLGIQGAALATVIDIALAAALNLYFIYRYTGFVADLADIFKNIVAATFMAGVLILLHPTMQIYLSAPAGTLTAFFIAIAVYFLVLLAIGGLKERDIKRLPLIGEQLAKSLARLKYHFK